MHKCAGGRFPARPIVLALALVLVGPSVAAAPTDEQAADAAAPPTVTAADSETATVDGAHPVQPDVETIAIEGEQASPEDPGVKEITVSGPGGDLVVVGVSWADVEAGHGLEASLRSRNGDTWSAWSELEITAPLNADEATPAMRGGTEPLAVMDADEIQVSLRGAPEVLPADPELVVVEPGESEADGAVPAVAEEAGVGIDSAGAVGTTSGGRGPVIMPRVVGDGAPPVIRTRADWGADESLRTWAPEIGRVTGVVVHHTAGQNGYTPEQVPAIIRGIYAYHAKHRGWGDIGYNVIVDAFGRAWEGRYGGLTKAVIGAHAAGVNGTTFGISVLGNFDQVPVPAAAFRTVAQVTAWKFAIHGISTSGTAIGKNGAAIGRVVGHRDVGNTSCPGRYFYPRLGELKTLITEYQGTPNAVTASRVAGHDRYGTAVAASKWSNSWADDVFIATGRDFPDALAAGAAAHLLDGPVLMVQPNGVPNQVKQELRRLGPDRIHVLGGPGVVSDGVLGELREFAPSVRRIFGTDRYETAALVARTHWTGTTTKVFVASGADYADALSGGAAAARHGSPLLLTQPHGLPNQTRDELRRLAPAEVVVLGGAGAVSDQVVSELQAAVPRARMTRLAGEDRYETSAAVARAFWTGAGGTVYYAAGLSWPDALAGVPSAGDDRAPLLLARHACSDRVVRDAAAAVGGSTAVVLGGEAVIGTAAPARTC